MQPIVEGPQFSFMKSEHRVTSPFYCNARCDEDKPIRKRDTIDKRKLVQVSQTKLSEGNVRTKRTKEKYHRNNLNIREDLTSIFRESPLPSGPLPNTFEDAVADARNRRVVFYLRLNKPASQLDYDPYSFW